jgi:autotransporter-associated beta strand protein
MLGFPPRLRSTITLMGTGIVNNSGIVQQFVTTPVPVGEITFTGTARAGSMISFMNNGGGTSQSKESFEDTSSADHAIFINNGTPDREHLTPGGVHFFDNSTAGNASFTCNGGAIGGQVAFFDTSTGGDATCVCNGGTTRGALGGQVAFEGSSTAGNGVYILNGTDTPTATGGAADFLFDATGGNATFIANGGDVDGGHIRIKGGSQANSARFEIFDNGSLDISGVVSSTSIGSLEGTGRVFLGLHNLSIGAGSLSTTFSGSISDGGDFGGAGGSLTKLGKSSLTLDSANTYTGGTTVSAGTLVINNTTGSGTGTGPVQVLGGTLAGGGTIAGAVTIGGDSLTVAVLAPGNRQQATLTIQGSLTFAISGTYTCTYRGNSRRVQFDQVIANGVVLNAAPGFNFQGTTRGNLRLGTVLTVISNTSSAPITGTFSNLPDGAIFAANGGNFQANYEGGDGNDLTLTVVP